MDVGLVHFLYYRRLFHIFLFSIPSPFLLGSFSFRSSDLIPKSPIKEVRKKIRLGIGSVGEVNSNRIWEILKWRPAQGPNASGFFFPL